MEHVRIRDNDRSPHPTENPAAPLIRADHSLLAPNRREFDTVDLAWPSLPPSTTDFQSAEKLPPRSKPLIRGFERPSLSRIVILTVLCLITYPAFYTLKLVAKDQSLFVVRLIVSIWCSGVGFALGYVLLKIGAQHLEAATWATVIHMSYEGSGMKLRDLARSSRNTTSFMPAFQIFRSRLWGRGTATRSRKSYDKRPWSLFVAFFVILAVLGPLIPFLFGRIMRIETFVRNQSKEYREVLIAGDLSQDDLTRASTQVVIQSQGVSRIWPASPYGGSASGTTEFVHGNDTVYFAQPSLSQLVPGGSGTGAFNTSQTASISLSDTPNTLGSDGRSAPESNTGVVLRYPQWGIRVHCEKLPNPEINLVPLSNQSFTYAFIPRDFLRGLFGTYGMDLPAGFASSPFFMIDENDTVPPNIDRSTIAWIGKFPNDGSGVSLRPLYPEETWDQEWITVETVLLRLDTDSAPSGRFPVYWNNSFSTPYLERVRTGYDAAICVQKYEPWIIETYNTSIVSPSALRIVGKWNDSSSLSPSGIIRGPPIANGTRNLNATGKNPVFIYAHENSIGGIMVTNNDWIAGYYRPTPFAVSFTNGTGPQGYTELSPDRLAVIRARAGAANTLPYLVGSGPIVAQSYGDETLAFATYRPWQLIGLPVLIWVLGMIGELFVPALPLGIPRREFGVYSWLALFQSQELRFEAANDLDKFMNLDKLEEKYSNKRVKFAM